MQLMDLLFSVGELIRPSPPLPIKMKTKTHQKANTTTKLSSEYLEITSIVKWLNLVTKNETLLNYVNITKLFFDNIPFSKDTLDFNCWLVDWFCCFTSQVNSYGHCGTVSSPNHTFSWAGLNKRLTSNLCTYFRL